MVPAATKLLYFVRYSQVPLWIIRLATLPLRTEFAVDLSDEDASFLRAIEQASPSLAKAIASKPDDPSVGASLRLYRARMSSRATPFGLLAHVGFLDGDALRDQRNDLASNVVIKGPAQAWVVKYSAKRSPYVINPQIEYRDGKLVLWDEARSHGRRVGFSRELYQRFVEMGRAESLSSVVAHVRDWSGVSGAEAISFVRNLVDSEILVSTALRAPFQVSLSSVTSFPTRARNVDSTVHVSDNFEVARKYSVLNDVRAALDVLLQINPAKVYPTRLAQIADHLETLYGSTPVPLDWLAREHPDLLTTPTGSLEPAPHDETRNV